MLNFPDNPTVGQIFQNWEWDGVKWVANPTQSFQTVPTPPPGDNSQIVANTAFVDRAIVSWSRGFQNKFYNGSFQVAQRGTSPQAMAAGGAMSLDGWRIGFTGSPTPNWSQVSNGNFRNTALRIAATGAITNVWCGQRVESIYAAQLFAPDLSLQPITVQWKVFNGTSAPITPTVLIDTPAVADTWSGTTSRIVSAVAPTPIAAAARATVAYTFMADPSMVRGIYATLQFQSVGTGNLDIAEADIRDDLGAPVGWNTSPPPAEMLDNALEVLRCLRYYQRGDNMERCHQEYTGGGNWYSWSIYPMRVTPSVAYQPTGAGNYSNSGIAANSANSMQMTLYGTTPGNIFWQVNWQATAEL